MEMRRSDDSSGTDDDLPPAQPALSRGGRVVGNGKAAGAAAAAAAYAPPGTRNLDQLVRKLEQDAYTAVLRAFGAQSEVITWAKESLISELRKELRVTDEQHREFLAKVHGDDSLRQVREWRECGEGPSTAPASNVTQQTQPASRKKHKTGTASMPPPPVPASKQQPTPSPSPALKKSGGSVPRGKSKGGANEKPSSGRKKKEFTSDESLVGQTIKIKWPADNNFYEAFVKEYHKEDGMHTLIYDMGTEKETSERVDLANVPECDLLFSKKKNSSEKGGTKRKATPPDRTGSQKWTKVERKGSARRVTLTLPSVDTLSKQMDDLGHEPDLLKIEHIKRLAKEHEEALRKVLVEVGESSDEGESDDDRERGSNGTRHRNGYSRNNHSEDEKHDSDGGGDQKTV